MSQSLESVFPTEIYERIIELSPLGEPLERAKRVLLRSYSVVSRQWRPMALKLAFRKMCFMYTRIPKLYAFGEWCRDHPLYAEFVEEVYILRQDSHPWNSCAELFPAAVGRFLPNLRFLEVRQAYYIDHLPGLHPILRTGRPQAFSITSLVLVYYTIQYSSDLDAILAPFPKLRSLHLKNMYWLPHCREGWKTCTEWPNAPKVDLKSLEELRIEQDWLPNGDIQAGVYPSSCITCG